MASPSAKYSNSASTTISASTSATHAVEPHSTSPTTNGIKTTAVATRFQVMEKESPGRPHERLTADSQKLKEKDKTSLEWGGLAAALSAEAAIKQSQLAGSLLPDYARGNLRIGAAFAN